MNAYRPDPVLRVLAAMAAVLYHAARVFGIILIVAVAAMELFAGPETREKISLGVAATVDLDEVNVGTAWGGALRLKLDGTDGSLRVPVATAPVWYRAAMYVGLAIIYALFLRFLIRLRELLQRVREGAPFDERNATGLRWLGLMLILIDVLASAYSFGLAQIVLRNMSSTAVPVTARFSLDGDVIVVGLVLLALSAIFRRGAILEEEQAHLV